MTTGSIGTLAIRRVTITVPDLDAAERFFVDALHCTRMGRRTIEEAERKLIGTPDARVTASLLGLGAQRLELLSFDPPGRPYPQGLTASDLWFQHCAIVVGDMASAHAHLSGFAVEPITEGGPQRLPPNTGAVTAWKFRDPYGHPFELIEFPQGVGAPVWHEPSRNLFRGIDHTAIAVGDAAASTRFYQDRLGFRAADRSVNTGPEQSRLDAVGNDTVVVQALTPGEAPPHLELLGYRAGTRRPRPEDWTAADIAVTRTVLRVDADTSAGSIADPDGHLFVLEPDAIPG